MPGGNKTGPAGSGPMTGRGAGYCAGNAMPGFANPINQCGFGVGGGRGNRNRFYAAGFTGWQRGMQPFPVSGTVPGPPPFDRPSDPAMTSKQEAETLKSQVDELENTLSEMKNRLQELDSEKKN